MNLKEKLTKQLKDTFTVTLYEHCSKWILSDIDRLCEKEFIDIDKPIKFTIGEITRIAKINHILFNSEGIVLDTGFGNIWFYDAIKPTKEELKIFDGHCLIL